MPLYITNLPPELLSEITRNVISKEDLCQLRSVNSLFEALVTPEIFNTITVWNNKQSVDSFCALLLTPRVALHIQSISFVEAAFTSAEKEVSNRLKVAFSLLHQAPGLKILDFHFSLHDSYQWDIVYALGSNRNPLPALQSLRIHRLLCCQPGDEFMLLFDKAPIAWLVASLRHLSLTLPRETTLNKEESFAQFWKQVVRCVLKPAVNLESLELRGNGIRVDAQCFGVLEAQLVTFPRLAALSLRCIVWEDDTGGPSEFIVRHQKTLKTLELRNCAIKVTKKKYGSQLPDWAEVSERLANSLTGIVDLKVEFDLKKYGIPFAFFNFPLYKLEPNN